MIDLLTANWQAVLVLLTAAALALPALYGRWKHGKLGELFDELYEHIKDEAGAKMDAITRSQFDDLSGSVYRKYVENTILGKFITVELFQDAAWAGFNAYRDRYSDFTYYTKRALD